jgi:hypothetical protein
MAGELFFELGKKPSPIQELQETRQPDGVAHHAADGNSGARSPRGDHGLRTPLPRQHAQAIEPTVHGGHGAKGRAKKFRHVTHGVKRLRRRTAAILDHGLQHREDAFRPPLAILKAFKTGTRFRERWEGANYGLSPAKGFFHRFSKGKYVLYVY